MNNNKKPVEENAYKPYRYGSSLDLIAIALFFAILVALATPLFTDFTKGLSSSNPNNSSAVPK